MDSFVVGGSDAAAQEDPLTLEELTALALSADVNTPIDPAAQPFTMSLSERSETLLPRWYMPAATAHLTLGWRRWVVVVLVAALIGIELSGLCSVFGQLVVG